MDSYTRDGLRFDVIDAGSASEGTIVLLHGFPQRATSWSAVLPRLVSAGYRVLAPDQRGYSPGARPASPKAYAMVELVADVAALIEAAGDGRVHLVGHDWGAAAAWAVAQQRPELLRSVMGVSVPPTAAFMKGLASPRQALASWYMLAFQARGIAEWAADPATSRGRKILHRALVKSGQTPARADEDIAAFGTAEGLRGGLNWYRSIPYSLRGVAAPITTPAMFVWSTGDTAVTSAAARLAGRYVSGPYRSATLAGVSHWIPDEQPAQLAQLILEHASRY